MLVVALIVLCLGSLFLCSFVDDVIDAHYLVISLQLLFQLFVIDVFLFVGFLLLIGQ